MTDDTVTISIIITDTSMVAQAFGWEVPDEGDREAQVEALVDHFNAAGGFAGRQIEAKVTVFNAITDGPVAEEALCNKITQDDQAFAAVLTGQFQENARPCYRNANTLMFDATLYPVDVAGFEELAPYYWSPLLPTYDDLVGGLAAALIEEGWFTGGTLGVIAIDSELSERVYDQQFAPRLEAAGVEVVSYNTIDPTDSTSFNNDQLQAIINFREAGVDKVVAIGGSRLVSLVHRHQHHPELRAGVRADQLRRPRLQRLQLPRDDARGQRHQRAPRLRHRGRPAHLPGLGGRAGVRRHLHRRRPGVQRADQHPHRAAVLRRVPPAAGRLPPPHRSERTGGHRGGLAVWAAASRRPPCTGWSSPRAATPAATCTGASRFDADCECMVLTGDPADFDEWNG